MFLPNRKYKSGTGWCLWRWTEVDSTYIRRLHVLKTPWFAICLHWLLKPDPEPYLHDHPVTFLSLILRGGYAEKREIGWDQDRVVEVRDHRWWNFIRATSADRHTIIEVKPRTLTLCFMGPKVREWGFHRTPVFEDGDGWQWWKDYYKAQREQKAREAQEAYERFRTH